MNDVLPDFPLDDDQKEVFGLIEKSCSNIFLQGCAGTGKTTFIKYLSKHSNKKIRIVCPTAAAAVNLGVSTIHSLYLLPLSDFFIFKEIERQPRKKLQQILTHTDVLVIDEVSMVRPDMLDAVDLLSRQARGNHFQPFGGLQVILAGDLAQLPPVIKQNVFEVFEAKYGIKQPYFFHSEAYKEACFKKIELTKTYRQNDSYLLEYLGNLRAGKCLKETAEYFNDCGQPSEDFIRTAATLTAYRRTADKMNRDRLAEINAPEQIYKCKTSGTFDDAKDCPAPRELALKPGALVIFNRNNPGMWINGTSGIVKKLNDESISVQLLSNGSTVSVQREEWKNYRYDFDRSSGMVKETETGTFVQFPLQLGYALTIHKAQGKTLDKAVIDMRHGTFAHGQLYVALSRTRKKSDMRIMGKIYEDDIIIDPVVSEFLSEK